MRVCSYRGTKGTDTGGLVGEGLPLMNSIAQGTKWLSLRRIVVGSAFMPASPIYRPLERIDRPLADKSAMRQ
jgi:hypothetical protein